MRKLPNSLRLRLAALAGEYFASVTVVAGSAYKTEMGLARFHDKHVRPRTGLVDGAAGRVEDASAAMIGSAHNSTIPAVPDADVGGGQTKGEPSADVRE